MIATGIYRDGTICVPRLAARSCALAPAAQPVLLPVPAITDTWQYTTDGNDARAAMMATDTAMPGTGYRLQPGDRPPWIRFVVTIACNQIGSDADPGRMWSNLLFGEV
jgi:hypothetical protein